MVAPSLTIQEVSGAQRSIVLRGRSLPYRTGITYEGVQRHKLRYYAGNPRGTLQVLGPSESPTKFEGMWKDRFLAGQVLFDGFDLDSDTLTAEQLVQAFDLLRRGGNELRVQWSTQVRNGILARFRAEPLRTQDWKWEAEFVWYSRDDADPPRAASDPTPQEPTLRTQQNALDDEIAFKPKNTAPAYLSSVTGKLDSVRLGVMQILAGLGKVNGLVETSATAVGALAANGEGVRVTAEDVLSDLVDVPYTQAVYSDRVLDVLAIERWRRNVGNAAAALRSSTIRQVRRTLRDARPQMISAYTSRIDQTLRAIAFKVYGNAELWQTIADANGLVGSQVSAGTVLVIPPMPAQAKGTSRGNLPT